LLEEARVNMLKEILYVLFIGFTIGFFIGCIIGYRVGLYKGNGGV